MPVMEEERIGRWKEGKKKREGRLNESKEEREEMERKQKYEGEWEIFNSFCHILLCHSVSCIKQPKRICTKQIQLVSPVPEYHSKTLIKLDSPTFLSTPKTIRKLDKQKMA